MSQAIAEECKRYLSYHEDTKLILHNNKTALDIIEKECLWVLESTISADLNGDGREDIAMITSGAGCGSCHVQELFVIDGDKVIFHKSGIEFTIQKAKSFVGFSLKQPIFKDDESYCCPSEGYVEGYEFRKGMNGNDAFTQVSKTIEPYNNI